MLHVPITQENGYKKNPTGKEIESLIDCALHKGGGGLDERDREDFWRTRSDLSIANKMTFSNLYVLFRRENYEIN